ncbi:MAG: DNA translocase FtsK [Planctomycetes bacterium]|nr:DNA translocase FtsK [Planctomycetota bacterium]
MSERKRGHRFVPIEDVPRRELGPRAREVLALAIVGLALFVLLALATFDRTQLDATAIPRGSLRNVGGVVGHRLADGLTWIFGAGAWILAIATAVSGVLVFAGRVVERPAIKLVGLLVFIAMMSVLLAGPQGDADPSRLFPYGPGGRFGANLSPRLYHALGGSGRLLVVLFGALCALLLATEWLLSSMLLRVAHGVEGAAHRVRELRPQLALAGASEVAAKVEHAEAEAGEGEASDAAPRRRRRRAPRANAAESGELAELAGQELAAADEDSSPEPEPASAPEPAAESDAAPPETPAAGAREPAGEEAQASDAESAAEPDEGEPAASVEARDAKARATRLRIERRAKQRKKARVRDRHPQLPFAEPWTYPPIELLRDVPEVAAENSDKLLEQNKEAIEKRLASFRLDAQVVAASVGPAVTQYELRLGEGIKLSKVTAFEADLAAALRALNVRVVAPIPGKDTVGIEVPNKSRQMVYLRELLEQYGLAEDKAIPLFLGKNVAGDPIVEDLARMPHLLIAGTTGSGKSVCINSILLSILLTRTPQEVRLVLIDPKMVELQVFRRVPHLACDVVTNMKRAPVVLGWAVDEMERRYTVLSGAGTNHIKSFNKLGKEEIERRLQRPIEPSEAHLPYIVVVIDELADLMNVAQKEVEESIQRLAQKSRAVGIHVILATQRPSTDVITGVIKANLPCQIAFKVNRKIDSRVILDSNGAEKLLGFGDMLFVSPTAGQMLRAQGAFVSEEETHGVCAWLEQHGPEAAFIPDLVQTETAKKKGLSERDDLYDQAAEVILGQQRGSATLIQRALAVGYTRATRLLEMMEEDGLVGPFLGSKSRDVLMTLEEWRAREAAAAEELEGGEDELDDAAEAIDDEAPVEDADESADAAAEDPDAEDSESADAGDESEDLADDADDGAPWADDESGDDEDEDDEDEDDDEDASRRRARR